MAKGQYPQTKRVQEAYKIGKPFCTNCEMVKEHSAFPFPPKSRSKRAWCGDCRANKPCSRCKEVLPVEDFPITHDPSKPRRSYCKSCARTYLREWRLKTHYSITQDEFLFKENEQGGVCYLCKSKPNSGKKVLVVDHDHATGQVRRLLCDKCNRGLGYFLDNPTALRAAADYIEAFK